jgi:hypothetical protein
MRRVEMQLDRVIIGGHVLQCRIISLRRNAFSGRGLPATP